jgi:arabinofuranosyltransferase
MKNQLKIFINNKFNIILGISILILIGLACANRFVLDDAFISFRYAENLVSGKGLVWNVGDRTEGYTNFLWTLFMAIPMYFGAEPVGSSYVLSILCYVISLILCYKLSLLVLDSRIKAFITVILLGTNYTFISYATGGMETQLQACLFVSIIYLLIKSISLSEWGRGRLLIISLLMSAAVLTRLDSAVLVAVVFLAAVYFILNRNTPLKEKISQIFYLGLPLLLTIGGWMVWKIVYYGDIFPNTYYAKVFSAKRGIRYLYLFFNSYLLIPLLLIFVLTSRKLFKKSNLPIQIILISVLVWLVYLIRVGGDFMEFRFMAPILPLLFIWISWTIFAFTRQEKFQAALIALVILGSVHHVYTFAENTTRYGVEYGIETIKELDEHISSTDQNWSEVGRVLGGYFDHNQDIIIATTAAGAIPYYSHLKTVDMLGLNDKWIAKHSQAKGSKPGHQKVASMRYLIKQGVNILIGHPWLKINNNPYPVSYSMADVISYLNNVSFMDIKHPAELPLDAKIIEIPIDRTHNLAVVYLIKNTIVDNAIKQNNWRVYPIIRTAGQT